MEAQPQEQQWGALTGAAQEALRRAQALVAELEAADAALAAALHEAGIANRWVLG